MPKTSLSRSGQSHADGKLDAHVHVVLSQQENDDLIGVAFAHGMSKSEYVRHVLGIHLYGAKASVQRRIAGRFAADDAMNVRTGQAE